MNIEIANRLVQLRKKNNLSQEALAEKLGISRQAVSKWERAEASPDTDNLILLARLYGVSLDELLLTDDEIPVVSYEECGDTDDSDHENGQSGEESYDDEEYVHVGFNGVHVKDKDGEVHVGWNGIHVDDRKKGDNVHIDKNGIYVNGEKKDKEWFSHHAHFPMFFLILIVYFVIGCAWGAWHPGWILFLLIPVWDSLLTAIEKKNAHCFAYPILVTVVFLCLGFFGYMWHPGWVVFVTIPFYYSLVSYLQNLRRQKREKDREESEEGTGKADEEQ